MGVNQGFPFDFDSLVYFTFSVGSCSSLGIGPPPPLCHLYMDMGSDLGVHRGFPFDFDPMVYFPFLWIPFPP